MDDVHATFLEKLLHENKYLCTNIDMLFFNKTQKYKIRIKIGLVGINIWFIDKDNVIYARDYKSKIRMGLIKLFKCFVLHIYIYIIK